jgi:hypothetical protein
LTRPKTTANINAVTNPSTTTPGTRYAEAKTATADRRREIIKLIVKKVKK